MKRPSSNVVLACLVGILFKITERVEANTLIPRDEPPPVNKEKKSEAYDCYIVQLKEDPILASSSTKPDKNTKLNPNDARVKEYGGYLNAKQDEVVATIGGESKKLWSFTYAFNGFSIKLNAAEAKKLANHDDVLSVEKDVMHEIKTDTSADFIGLTGPGEPWSLGYTGENVVVGIIDTGVNPEHPSFADIETPINGNQGENLPYGAPPVGWSGTGCVFGEQDFNPNDAPAECSNKLLTARCFATAFSAEIDRNLPCGGDGAFLDSAEFLSARDLEGHGSHVASTAAGNYAVEAAADEEPSRSISGMAPRARIAVYKVCWRSVNGRSCSMSDILAALDQAIADGCDVINASLGSSITAINNVEDRAFLRAADAGIFTAVAGGNTGPGEETIGTPSGLPWVTSVGAAQDDSVLGIKVVVTAPSSVAGTYAGTSTNGINGTVPFEIDDEISGEMVPADPLDACAALENDLTGKIALVIRGTCTFTDKFDFAAASGATAIIVYNDGTTPDRIDPISMSVTDVTIPGTMISFTVGDELVSTSRGEETLSGGFVGGETVTGSMYAVPAPNVIASFSSRGPYSGAPDIIKPDLVAPGVSVLAAGANDSDNIVLQGTSMSSPHVAGVFALLKQAHPDWTPAVAKSALMTTSRQDLTKTLDGEAADPFDMGSGHIQPGNAFDPGLAFDAGLADYHAFTCGVTVPFPGINCIEVEQDGYSLDVSDLNYASIGIAELPGVQTVRRTVTNVATTEGTETFVASVESPPGIDITVTPNTITLERNMTATYEVTVRTTDDVSFDGWSFGSMTWSNNGGNLRKNNIYSVRSPIAVLPIPFSFPSSVSGLGSFIGTGVGGSLTFDVGFSFTGSYTAGTHGFAKPLVQEGTVPGDPSQFYRFPDGAGVTRFRFSFPPDTAFARFALFDEFTDGEDDLDLFVWECTANAATSSCGFVDSSGSPTSTETVDVLVPKSLETDNIEYIVDVHGFDTEGPDSNFSLFQWGFGIDDDRNNVVVDAPDSAVTGTKAQITLSWPDENTFDLREKYLGAVSHSTSSGLLGLTLVQINT